MNGVVFQDNFAMEIDQDHPVSCLQSRKSRCLPFRSSRMGPRTLPEMVKSLLLPVLG